jgi:nitrite reductase/ring-hydroxylating ferredoxin subunit
MADPQKPDFKNGFSIRDLKDGGMVLGQIDGEDAILARRGDEFFAVGAFCTHYHGPLADGLMVDDTVRCPWHHACFSLRTGEALRAPALDPIACWRVEKVDDKVFAREKQSEPAPKVPGAEKSRNSPVSVVIVGGGAAGLAAADMLRREGYAGPLTLITSTAGSTWCSAHEYRRSMYNKNACDWKTARRTNSERY